MPANYDRIQNAINFIETHLDENFSLTDVSNAAFSSLSYFHRVFYFMTGFTVKDYIRQRRLAKAAYQLRCETSPIMQIALNAGFETAESFSRAFKKHFHHSPREFRKSNNEQILFPKIDVAKDYQQRTKPKLDFDLQLEFVLYKKTQVLGLQTHTTIENGQQAVDICNFANEVIESGKLAQLFDLSETPIYGVYTNMTDENDFDYTIACLPQALKQNSNQLKEHTIPNSHYARFSINRIDRIKEAWHYIYGYWFLENNQQRSKGFDFEIYHQDSVDIYIPMLKV